MKNAKWKTTEEAQAGMEGMAADVAQVKEQLGQLLELVQKLSGPETKEPEPEAAEQPPADAPVMKWLKELSATGTR